MAALVQSFPQPTSSATMLQTRPSSASGILQSTSANQQYTSQPSRGIHRNSYHGMTASAGSNIYRGQNGTSPIQPYGFQSTPNMNGYRQQAPHLRQDQRTISAPANPYAQGSHPTGQRHSRYPASASVSTTTSSSSSDMSAPNSAVDGSEARISAVIPTGPTKPVPERYRRGNRSASAGLLSGQTAPVRSGWDVLPSQQLQQQQQHIDQAAQQAAQQLGNSFDRLSFSSPVLSQNFSSGNVQHSGTRAMDDMYVRKPDQGDMRNRRRSIHAVGGNYFDDNQMVQNGQPGYAQQIAHNQHPLRSSPVNHAFTSLEKVDKHDSQSSRNRAASAPKRDTSVTAAGTSNPASPTVTSDGSIPQNQNKLVNVPPRGSSAADAIRRTASPLSKPNMNNGPAATKDSFASAVNAALQPPSSKAEVRPASPAASKLAQLNDKAGKKPSRLRRAFSFGSAAELRKASGETGTCAAADRARLRKEQHQDAFDAEQARIARKQEEGGIGAGIYNGQGNFFSSSTDNLSISSTASSASIMIRKMGKGMKKSTRSLVGLFRPKSVIGVPSADSPVPQAEISMVTVEAERQRVNVTAVKSDNGGGTGFPKLERNSIDAANAVRPSASTEDSGNSRKSIVGGEDERAHILATMKKGILKRNGTDSGNSSPVVGPSDGKSPHFGLPPIPHVDDSPQSSAPSTPKDEGGHKRSESVTLNGEDYFMSALRFSGGVSQSVPVPVTKRNISWKNTTNYHDTWASTEYDRRGEIATCNRLTPMLAQQIKEELNSFKMEMEVHETSKIYTHFF